MKTVKAENLLTGDQFKLDGQRKFRTVAKITTLKNSPIVAHHNKILIVTDACKHHFAFVGEEIEVLYDLDFRIRRHLNEFPCTNTECAGKPDCSECIAFARQVIAAAE